MTERFIQIAWYEAWNEARENHGLPEDCLSYDRDTHHAALREAFRGFLLRFYREQLRSIYRGLPLGGTDPLVVRVIQRHHWTIDAAKNLSESDLMLALADDLSHFKLPENAVHWAYGQLRDLPSPEGHDLLDPHRPEEMEELPT